MDYNDDRIFSQIVRFFRRNLNNDEHLSPFERENIYESYNLKSVDCIAFKKNGIYISAHDYEKEVGIRIFKGRDQCGRLSITFIESYEWRFSDFADFEQFFAIFNKQAKLIELQEKGGEK